jgi:type VI secretion system secreted protein Hcp
MAANYFLKFEGGIKAEGESKQKGFEKQIEVLSFSWGVSQSGGFSFGGGGSSSQANVQDLSLSFRQNAASPMLMRACAGGTHYDKALLTCLKAAGDKQEKYLEIEMEDVIISSYQTGGSGDDMPVESMSLNFAKVTQKFYTQDDKGVTKLAASATYDQATATAE